MCYSFDYVIGAFQLYTTIIKVNLLYLHCVCVSVVLMCGHFIEVLHVLVGHDGAEAGDGDLQERVIILYMIVYCVLCYTMVFINIICRRTLMYCILSSYDVLLFCVMLCHIIL